MGKPHSRSVTDQPCECGYLQQQADNPDVPIVYDVRCNEFHFEYPSPPGDGDEGAKSTLCIYHCPFCGGAAPESKRDLLFAAITIEEQNRLDELLAGITTINDAIRKLGNPDHDHPTGFTTKTPERDETPPTIESFRTIVYCGLSNTTEVHITDLHESIRIRLQGKYLG